VRRLLVPTGVGMIALTFGLARYGYGLLLPDMRAALGMGAGTAGLVGSSAYLGYLVANTAVVPLTVRTGPRLPLALATVAAAGGMSLIAIASDVAWLTAGVLLAGASAGFAFPPYADIVATVVPQSRRATAWAAISSGTGWGVAVAGPVVVVAGVDWRTAWLGFAAVAAGVGSAAVLSAPAGGDQASARAVALRVGWFVCPQSGPLLACAVVIGAGSSVWWAFSVDAMRDFGVSASAARLVYAGCGIAGVLATLTGPLVDRAGQRTAHAAAVLALVASLGVSALAGSAPSALAAAAVGAVLFGVSYNAVIAVQGLWSADVFADRPSAGLAAVSTGLTLGTLAGPALGGLAIEVAGFPVALLLAAAVTALAWPLAPPPEPSSHSRSKQRHAVRTGV